MDELVTDQVDASRTDRLSIGRSENLDDHWGSEGWKEDEEHPPPLPEAEVRDWAGLPRGVLSEIFRKVGAMEVMLGAQSVCCPWRALSWEPETWRVVDMMTLSREMGRFDLLDMAKAVIERSKGMMEELYVYRFGDDDLMKFVSERTNRLKCLGLKSCYNISEEALTDLVRRFPMLESVEISICPVSEDFVEEVGHTCPHLKRFGFNQESIKYEFSDDGVEASDMDNLEAYAIADNMKELQHLQLLGNALTKDGLHAILDGCHKLQFLDVRGCYNLSLDESLRKKCARITNFKLPDEEISDREFTAEDYDYVHDAYPDDLPNGNYGIDHDGYVYDDAYPDDLLNGNYDMPEVFYESDDEY